MANVEEDDYEMCESCGERPAVEVVKTETLGNRHLCDECLRDYKAARIFHVEPY